MSETTPPTPDLQTVEDVLRSTGIRLVIPLRPIVKKNRRPIQRGRVGKSAALRAWEEDATTVLRFVWGGRAPIAGPLNAKIVSFLGARQVGKNAPDASNLYEAPQDALEAAGVIENDRQIESHDGSRRRWDRHNPRIEITLTRAAELGGLEEWARK